MKKLKRKTRNTHKSNPKSQNTKSEITANKQKASKTKKTVQTWQERSTNGLQNVSKNKIEFILHWPPTSGSVLKCD